MKWVAIDAGFCVFKHPPRLRRGRAQPSTVNSIAEYSLSWIVGFYFPDSMTIDSVPVKTGGHHAGMHNESGK